MKTLETLIFLIKSKEKQLESKALLQNEKKVLQKHILGYIESYKNKIESNYLENKLFGAMISDLETYYKQKYS